MKNGKVGEMASSDGKNGGRWGGTDTGGGEHEARGGRAERGERANLTRMKKEEYEASRKEINPRDHNQTEDPACEMTNSQPSRAVSS